MKLALYSILWLLIATPIFAFPDQASNVKQNVDSSIQQPIYVKPCGKFKDPQHFESERLAMEYQSKFGGGRMKDYISGLGWFVIYVKDE